MRLSDVEYLMNIFMSKNLYTVISFFYFQLMNSLNISVRSATFAFLVKIVGLIISFVITKCIVVLL